jgi:hypothetical protein
MRNGRKLSIGRGADRRRDDRTRRAAATAAMNLETMESRRMLSAAPGIRLTLVSADTNKDLMPVTEGMTVNLASLPTRRINIRADAAGSGTLESVRFGYDGNANWRVETSLPFAFAGDTKQWMNAWTPGVGGHTLTATGFTGDFATGSAGAMTTVHFNVIDNAAPPSNPTATAPAAPSASSATARSSSQIQILWKDMSSNESGFIIERSTDGTTFKQVGTAGAGATSYTSSGLAASTKYYFRVKAQNSVGMSAASNVVSATTSAIVANPPPDQPPTTPTDGTRPGASNTGPKNLAALRASGSITVTQDNAVIENIDVTGTITISAKNVTVRNFRVTSSSGYCVKVTDGGSATLEDGDLNGGGVTAGVITGPNITARRLNIYNSGSDGISAKGNELIEWCWIHDLGHLSSSHADGLQMTSGSNVVIRYNNFDMPKNVPGTKSNAAVFLKADFGNIDNITVDHNWMNGGNFTVYAYGVGSNTTTNVRFTNNEFGRDYQYGVKSFSAASPVWTGNVWDDTGAAIT